MGRPLGLSDTGGLGISECKTVDSACTRQSVAAALIDDVTGELSQSKLTVVAVDAAPTGTSFLTMLVTPSRNQIRPMREGSWPSAADWTREPRCLFQRATKEVASYPVRAPRGLPPVSEASS